MKTSTALLLGGGIAAAIIFSRALNTGAAVKKLQFRNPKLKFKNVSLFSITATVTIDVFNPTATDIPVTHVSGNIMYQGRNLSAFAVDGTATRLVVKKQGTTPVVFDVVINNTGALSVLLSIINGGFNAVIDVTGLFHAMGTDNPFGFKYDVLRQQMVSTAISGKASVNGTAAKASVNGIAGVEAKLQFSSNAEMEKYFASKRYQKKLMFSKN